MKNLKTRKETRFGVNVENFVLFTLEEIAEKNTAESLFITAPDQRFTEDLFTVQTVIKASTDNRTWDTNVSPTESGMDKSFQTNNIWKERIKKAESMDIRIKDSDEEWIFS